ncbi:YbhB/YbcL family Raf kinase inhibitor-like protein [uncultured Halovibrio sp.]|uniref:YbhB/YbcL family Raf kinase inhibitor-like protein n=1 Tax=uncultured Halovibrio sp. TaxID=985049 RepID=UPI0025CD297B|nr:YbhB/YbcL family Raf kinase inhibitor-like protein [uncultured Halovibrio sp.]
MRLSSPAFSEGDPIPWQYTAPKANELPPFQIQDVPEQACSLVLMIEDVDSPLGTLTHWMAWNIPPDTQSLDAVNLPAECCIGRDSFGKIGYLGPIPPEGRHHYRFSVLALDTKLKLEAGATRPALERAMKAHVLDQAALNGIVDANPSEKNGGKD